MSRAQISALVCGVGGFGALVAATTSNEWKVTTRASSVITATWVYQGLWMNCAGNALGSFHCRPHFTIFKVEGKYERCVCGCSKMLPSLPELCQQAVGTWRLTPRVLDNPQVPHFAYDEWGLYWLKDLNCCFG